MPDFLYMALLYSMPYLQRLDSIPVAARSQRFYAGVYAANTRRGIRSHKAFHRPR